LNSPLISSLESPPSLIIESKSGVYEWLLKLTPIFQLLEVFIFHG
jgi:hypothetical protein